MEKKAIIGISSSLITDNGGMFPGYKRAYVNKDYVDAVLSAGAIPFIIPFSEEEDVIKEQVSLVDGIIISGGHDVFPLNYNEELAPKISEVFPERDKYEMCLINEAKKFNKAILGICRGFQLINVLEGGSLYQDLSYMNNDRLLKHSQGHTPSLATHYVNVKEESILKEIVGKEKIMVNSFHHQAIKEVAKDFVVSAVANDGVVEAIENKAYKFYMGVQWHPEMLFKNDSNMKKIFEYFIKKSL